MWKDEDTAYIIIHGENEKNKYIAKIDLKKYTRYFYSLDAYRAYLNKGKSKIADALTKVKTSIKSKATAIKKVINKASNTLVSKAKKTKETTEAVSKYLEKYGSDKISELADKFKPKYLYKERVGFGKYRYFYDEKSHQIWLEKQKYLKDEPDFMKNIPKTKDMTDPDAPVAMSADNQEAANKGWTDDMYRTNNCFFCTTAYELRQRGYDVVAKQTEQGTRGMEAYDIFENPKIVGFTKDVENNPDELKRQLVANSGPGTRGNICVQFKPYGGHSMAYEISPDGKEVVIVDAQTNECWDLARIAANINASNTKRAKEDSSMFFRTDNLKLKPAVLNLVQPANTKPQLVLGEEDSVSDRKTTTVSNFLSTNTPDDYKSNFDENGNPTYQPEVIHPDGYDEAKIKVTWR